MNKVVLTISIALISALFGCSSSKNIGTTSMPDPKPRSSKIVLKEEVSISSASNSATQPSNLSNSSTAANSSTPANSSVEPSNKPSTNRAIVVKEERVKVIEEVGTPVEPGKYYVVMGSFRVLENARNLKTQLIIDHFNPLLLQNEDGLYRVAAGTFSQETPARDRIEAIRSQSDKYDDVWLLVQKQ